MLALGMVLEGDLRQEAGFPFACAGIGKGIASEMAREEADIAVVDIVANGGEVD